MNIRPTVFGAFLRHQLSPDFEPLSFWHSLYQTQNPSRDQCRQQGVQCVAQRSDEHGGLVSSRWNIRHRLRCCVLQKLGVHKSEVVLELETDPARFFHHCHTEPVLQPVFRTSAIFVAKESLLRCHAQILCVLIEHRHGWHGTVVLCFSCRTSTVCSPLNQASVFDRRFLSVNRMHGAEVRSLRQNGCGNVYMGQMETPLREEWSVSSFSR